MKLYALTAIMLALLAARPAQGQSYLSQFEKTVDSAIEGCEDRIITQATPEHCAESCVLEPGFLCKSFDYYKPGSRCELSSCSTADAGLVSNYSTYDHYARAGFSKTAKPDQPEAQAGEYLRYFSWTRGAYAAGADDIQLSNASREDCARACIMESSFYCKSFDYLVKENKCRLSRASPAKEELITGSQYHDYYARSEFGSPFHSAVAAQISSPQAPAEPELEMFTRTRDAAIQAHNDKRLTGLSPADCARACLSETSFYCKSFDYSTGVQECDLSKSSAEDAGGLSLDYSPFDHYSRKAEAVATAQPSREIPQSIHPESHLALFSRMANSYIEGHDAKSLSAGLA